MELDDKKYVGRFHDVVPRAKVPMRPPKRYWFLFF